METLRQPPVPDKKFLVTVAAFDALDATDIEEAIRRCPWSSDHLGGEPVYTLGEDGLEPKGVIPFPCEGHKGQRFCLVSKTDGTQQLVLLPDEIECQDNAFGPSPFSPQFEQYRRTYALDRTTRSHADFNLVAIAAAVIDTVGWAVV